MMRRLPMKIWLLSGFMLCSLHGFAGSHYYGEVRERYSAHAGEVVSTETGAVNPAPSEGPPLLGGPVTAAVALERIPTCVLVEELARRGGSVRWKRTAAPGSGCGEATEGPPPVTKKGAKPSIKTKPPPKPSSKSVAPRPAKG